MPIEIQEIPSPAAKALISAYHPLGARACLRGAKVCLAGYEDGWPSFVALFTTPRSRWKHYPVTLELSRLAWSPLARRSASTFLRKCLRYLRRRGLTGLVVTYALPGTSGLVYTRAGFQPAGVSSGAPWSRRGPGERPTPNTIGTGRALLRFFYPLSPPPARGGHGGATREGMRGIP